MGRIILGIDPANAVIPSTTPVTTDTSSKRGGCWSNTRYATGKKNGLNRLPRRLASVGVSLARATAEQRGPGQPQPSEESNIMTKKKKKVEFLHVNKHVHQFPRFYSQEPDSLKRGSPGGVARSILLLLFVSTGSK